jgi:hypothetical protein
MVQAGQDQGAIRLDSVPQRVLELPQVHASDVFDDGAVVVGVLRYACHCLVDALEELIPQAGLLRVMPVAGLLDVASGQRREANRMRQRGDGGNGRRAFKSPSTSSQGRAAFASSSKVSSRSLMMRSTSGVTDGSGPRRQRRGASAGWRASDSWDQITPAKPPAQAAAPSRANDQASVSAQESANSC